MDVLGALEKAKLIVVEGMGVPPMLEFKYNPEQYTIEKSAEWNRPQTNAAESTPRPEYAYTHPATISMEIFIDDFEDNEGEVWRDVETLFAWTKPTPLSIDDGQPQPPLLTFQWGISPALAGFRGYLRSVSARYTMFDSDGMPLRATCNISLEEVPFTLPWQNPTSGTQPGLRRHVLIAGETLHSIAWDEYRNPRYWRGIAAYNDIDDPLRVPAGTTLLLPGERDAARMS